MAGGHIVDIPIFPKIWGSFQLSVESNHVITLVLVLVLVLLQFEIF